MFCQECGTEFNGKFCPNCGTPAANAAPGAQGAPESSGQASSVPPRMAAQAPVTPPPVNMGQMSGSPKPEKKKKGKKILIPVIVIIVLFVACSALFGNDSKDSSSSGSQGEAQEAANQAGAVSEGGKEDAEAAGNEAQAGAGDEGQAEAAAAEEGKEAEKKVDYEVKQEYFNEYENSIGMHLATAFVEIENTGTAALYLHDCTFDIEDDNGHLLTTEKLISTCPDVILPGETGYFYDDYIDLDDVDTSNGARLVPHYEVEEARNEVVDYETGDLDIREDSMSTCRISGRLTNTTDEEINLIYVNAVFYDADGNVLGISGTNLTEIGAGDTESFEIMGRFFRDGVSFADIADYKVIPRAWYMQF